MKRIIYFTIALALVAVGCTKSNIVDVPEAQKTPITFDVYNGRTPETKATEITTETIKTDGFYVAAFVHNESVSGTGEDQVVTNTTNYTDDYMSSDVEFETTWTTDVKAYWPAAGSLDFVAYGLNANKIVNETREEILGDYPTIVFDENYPFTKFTYTVPQKAADQEDLVVSPCMAKVTSETNGATGGTITFTMKHLLSRVGFKLHTIGEGAQVIIHNITLHGGFVNEGTVDLTSNPASITPSTNDAKITSSYSLFANSNQKFTTDAGNETIAIYDNSQITPDSTNEQIAAASANRYMMIMPGQVKDLANNVKPYIEVEYELTGTGLQIAKLPLVKDNANWTFNAGYAYEFIFTVSVSAIEFEGVVENWVEYGDIPVN